MSVCIISEKKKNYQNIVSALKWHKFFCVNFQSNFTTPDQLGWVNFFILAQSFSHTLLQTHKVGFLDGPVNKRCTVGTQQHYLIIWVILRLNVTTLVITIRCILSSVTVGTHIPAQIMAIQIIYTLTRQMNLPSTRYRTTT